MLARKGFRVAVIDGVDLEESVFLTGDRISVGSGPGDDLRLGGARIVPGHLVFARSGSGDGWEYFTSGSGEVEVDRGNPRTGPVRAGLTMSLGPDTRIRVTREPLPAALAESGGDGKKEIPLVIALPIMAAFVVGFGLYVQMLASGGSQSGPALQTERWLADLPNYGQALDECLEAAGAATASRVPAGDPDAPFRAYSAATLSDPERLPDLRLALGREIRSLIVSTHLMAGEGRYAEAADTIRRVPAMLPTGAAPCPINSAARADFATLDRRANR
jgi:hypothetical protein